MNKSDCKINSSVFRYVVPFKYGLTFEEAFKCIDDKKDEWERKNIKDVKAEVDLFPYLNEEFYFVSNDEEITKEKQGYEWLLKNDKYKDFIFHNFKKDESKNDIKEYSLKFSIEESGLFLFRNNIGFFWYELKPLFDKVEFNEDVEKKELLDILLEFQYEIKELNGIKSIDGSIVQSFTILEKNDKKPFVFGNWINSKISELEAIYFAQRPNNYEEICDLIRKYEKIDKKLLGENLKQCDYAPDKALMLSFVCFNEGFKTSSAEKRLLAYRLANGYDQIGISEESSYKTESPLDNEIWFSSQEGTSILVWGDTFFNKEIQPSRIKEAYFKLFIKIMYQSYSLSVFTSRIQEEFPTISKDNLDFETGDKITSLYWDVNNFLLKSTVTSVSYIDKHTLFYNYLKQQLRIKEDINSVSAGLEALNNLQKELFKENKEIESFRKEEEDKKRSGKISALMGLLTIFSLSSGLDSIRELLNTFINVFQLNIEIIGTIDVVSFVIWIVIVFITIYITIKTLLDAFSRGNK